jgi:hypothetical protein
MITALRITIKKSGIKPLFLMVIPTGLSATLLKAMLVPLRSSAYADRRSFARLSLVVEPISMGSNLCCYHYQYKKPLTRRGCLYW